MTRRDYVAIAKASHKATVASGELCDKSNLVMELCITMQAENPRFDVQRFEKACRDGVK